MSANAGGLLVFYAGWVIVLAVLWHTRTPGQGFHAWVARFARDVVRGVRAR